MPSLIKLDHDGIREVLTSQPEVVAEVARLGEEVAANVRAHSSVQAHGMRVDTRQGTTDRTRVTVAIAHPGGLAVQAKYGALTQAAASAGLEVVDR